MYKHISASNNKEKKMYNLRPTFRFILDNMICIPHLADTNYITKGEITKLSIQPNE